MEENAKAIKRNVTALGQTFDEKIAGSSISRFGINLGLCSDCSYLYAFVTEYGNVCARCSEFNRVRINAGDPVKQCTVYKKRSFMDLYDMKDIAIYIDPSKRQAGFILEEDEEDDVD